MLGKRKTARPQMLRDIYYEISKIHDESVRRKVIEAWMRECITIGDSYVNGNGKNARVWSTGAMEIGVSPSLYNEWKQKMDRFGIRSRVTVRALAWDRCRIFLRRVIEDR